MLTETAELALANLTRTALLLVAASDSGHLVRVACERVPAAQP
jgi:hypothetical protein